MHSVFSQFRIFKPYDPAYGGEVDVEQWHDGWKTVTEDEVPELKEELESHFRDLLGVDNKD